MKNLSKNIVTRRLPPDGTAATTFTLSAGTTDVNSGSVDTLGYRVCRFIVLLGTLSANAIFEASVEQSSDDGSTDTFTGVTGTKVAVSADTDDDKLLIVEVRDPQERYLRLAFNRGTGNSVIDGVLAELAEPWQAAITDHATVEMSEVHVSPAAGTI